jgi:acyl-CoA synthetase (AMP-forming)/AMP-acid ligase II/acyl carrier protein
MLELQDLNLAEILAYRATDESGTADRIAFTFLQDGENISNEVNYRELARRAYRVARHLQEVSAPHDRVLLLYPPSIDYIAAFFGCICAGRIAVPAFPPGSSRHLSRLRLILEDAEAHVALCSATTLDRVRYYQQSSDVRFDDLAWLVTDTLSTDEDDWQPPPIAKSDIAFLQYTSGSTGAPKGVMLAHDNLLANIFYCERAHHRPNPAGGYEVGVGWLPPYHDFGLIAGIIGPVCAGAHSIHMPPFVFLMQPLLWLKALTKYRARVTGAPNFAFELCTRKIKAEQKKSIDLSALEILVNGAEPIRMETLRRFTDAFAGCGFNPRAIVPGYGLAESTLLVTANVNDRAPDGLPHTLTVARQALGEHRVVISDPADDKSVELVSVGAKLPDHDIAIVDPASLRRCAATAIGEIWVRGPSVAQGYHKRPVETEATFGARIDGEAERWLRTGDLGFIAEGALYVTGRTKEVMIFSGHNIYPQDVEACVEALDRSFRPMSCAAFSIERDSGTDLVVVQEVEFGRKPVLDGLQVLIRGEIDKQHGIFNVAAILLVKAGTLPRTTSGKIQRLLCREMFLHDEFSPLWAWRRDSLRPAAAAQDGRSEPANETERRLVEIFREVLGVDEIGVSDNFLSLGGDSIIAIQIISRAGQAGIRLAPKDIFQCSTIAELAAAACSEPQYTAEQGLLIGPCPTTPDQHRCLAQTVRGNAPCHPSLLLHLGRPLPTSLLEAACRAVVAHHDALRLRFDEGGQAIYGEATSAPVEVACINLDESDVGTYSARLDAHRQHLCARLDPLQGRLFAAQHCKLADGEESLLLAIHRLACDAASWPLISEDLDLACCQLLAGRPVELPAKSSSFRQYAQQSTTFSAAPERNREQAFWSQQSTAALPLPLAAVPGKREYRSLRLAGPIAEGLGLDKPNAYRLRAEELVTAALLRILIERLQVDTLSLMIDERNGSFPDLDLTRTVGWISHAYPLGLSWPKGGDAVALKTIKEQMRAVPHGGLGYLATATADHAVPAEPPIALHFYRAARATPELLLPLDLRWPAAPAIDVTIGLGDGQLEIAWQYHPDHRSAAGMTRFGEDFVRQLERLVVHCASAPAAATPSDFPLANITQARLDQLSETCAADRLRLEDIYPLTDIQRDMLVQAQRRPDVGLYAEQFVCCLDAALDDAALEQACTHLFERHPALRSAPLEIAGALCLQAVYADLPLPFARADWRDLPEDAEDARNERLAHYLQTERNRGFDLARPPLSRLALIRYDENCYQFVWTYHHVFCDGWSMALLLHELVSLYGTLVEKRPLATHRAPAFRDYLDWLAGQPELAARTFWQHQLAGLTGPTPLDGLRGAPARQGHATQEWELDQETSSALHRFASREGFTQSTLIQGVWGLLLSHYSGLRDVVFGATFSSRPPELTGVETMVGLLINDLPVRVRVDQAGCCTDWLRSLHLQNTELHTFEHTPLDLIHECSGLPAEQLLFESIVVVQNYPVDPTLLMTGPLPIWSVDFEELSHYPLLFSVMFGDTLTIHTTFDRQRFDDAVVSAMTDDIGRLLRALLAAPDTRIGPLLAVLGEKC